MSCIDLDKGFQGWCIFLIILQEGKPACRHSKHPAMLTAQMRVIGLHLLYTGSVAFQKRPKSSDISGINSVFCGNIFLEFHICK